MTAIPDQHEFGDYGEWPGRDVLDDAGELLGGVVEIYLDDATNMPEWVLVKVSAGTPRFVPLAGAKVEQEAIRVAQPATRVEGAPEIDPRVELTQNQERDLYAHYGLRYSEEESDSGLPASPPSPGASAPAERPRLRRYAGPETVAVGEPPPDPAEAVAAGAAGAAAEPPPEADPGAAGEPPPAAEAAAPRTSPSRLPPEPRPIPPVTPPPPPSPAPDVASRRPSVPPALAAGAAAGLLTVLLVLRRRRRR